MVYVFLADGFEEIEALTPVDILRRGGVNVVTVGVGGKTVTSSHKITVAADIADSELTELEGAEGVILPGGMPGTLNLKASQDVRDAIQYCFDNGKLIAAICAAPSIFGCMGLLEGKKVTSFPGFENELRGAEYTGAHVETDGNVITAKGAGCALSFGRAIVAFALSENEADKVLSDMQCF